MERSSHLIESAAMPKLAFPSATHCYLRQQVFKRLDRLAAFSFIWISAPAGYGKTTAVSSYLQTRRRPTAWYQCDDADGDIASFFHYVAQAKKRLTRNPQALSPGFAPEYLSALPTFCRNFFRHWFAQLPHSSVLVLDNWQDLPVEASLRNLLPVIAEEIPARVQLIVISRDQPEPNLARWIAAGRIGFLTTTDLQLSRPETATFMRLYSAAGSAAVTDPDSLHETTQGWAAGVTLLLNSGVPRLSASWSAKAGESQSLFDYLATEAFDSLEASAQEVLLKAACLDEVAVPVARRMAARGDVVAILKSLTRRNVFTSYCSAADSYRLHPLFRHFLTQKLAKMQSERRRDYLRAVAHALRDAGEPAAGIEMLIRAEAWQDASNLIRHVAPFLVEQSRLTTLSQWIDALPPSIIAAEGWLLYWRGLCRLSLDFMAARTALESAYLRFCATGDSAGQALSCAAILQHIAYTYLDYRPMLPWLDRLEQNLESCATFTDSRTELKVRAGFMLALSQAIPKHPKLLDSVERVSNLVKTELDTVTRAEGASALLHFFSRFGRTPQYGDLGRIVDQLLQERSLPALHRLNLLWLHAYQLHSSGDPNHVLEILSEARALARHEGLHSEDTRMRLCELQAREIGASSSSALAAFSELEPLIRGMPPIPHAHFLYVRALFELACGHTTEALVYAEQALPLIRACHWHIGEALSLTGLAEVYCSLGRHDDAVRRCNECAALIDGVTAPLVEFNLQLVRAEIARSTQDTCAFKKALATAFAVGREQGYANGFHTGSQLLRRLICYGIEFGIEISYCRWVIAKRRFFPAGTYAARWPWPVKIRACGQLQIFIEDDELVFRGKAQRKPLDILERLIARPGGIDMSSLMDAVWPDLDGDAARNALDIALHRLRKMLKVKGAVHSLSGRLAFDENLVWLDTQALERLCAPSSSQPLDLSQAMNELLDLYRGPFLGGTSASLLLQSMQDRLRRKFVDRVARLAQQLIHAQRCDEAVSLYRRALEREPEDPVLRRGLGAMVNGDPQSREHVVVPVGHADAPLPIAHHEARAT